MTDGATTVLLDARWLGKTGTGTFTRSLLIGLAEVAPPGKWLVWGSSRRVGPLWDGAVLVPTEVDPAAWFGQRSALRIPDADLVFHPHQTRPLHRCRTASCILDLIQLQPPLTPLRAAKALRLRLSIRAADALFAISAGVRDQLASAFDIDPGRIGVLRLPVDSAAAARVTARREARPPARVLLAVGRFTPHKNHERLIAAFARTRFAAAGGQLHLVGGPVERLRAGGGPLPQGVWVRGALDAHSLEQAFADALVLVQPSLVEGYGLPVAEALAAGVPVTSSPVPAATEFGPKGLPVFDPTSVTAIAEAIDATVDLVDAGRYWDQVDRASWLAQRPTPASLAKEVLDGLRRAKLL